MLCKGQQVLFYVKSAPLKNSAQENGILKCVSESILAVVRGNFKANLKTADPASQ